MPGVSLIVKLGYEEFIRDRMEEGWTGLEILEGINEDIARRIEEGEKIRGPISRSAYTAYHTKLRRDTVIEVHRPDIAQEVAEKGLDVIGRISTTVGLLDELLEVAQNEVDMFTGGKNWNAILGVLQEARKQAVFFTETMEKIYNADQIRMFQESVMEAIEEADADTARKVRDKMREKVSMRTAALLGGG